MKQVESDDSPEPEVDPEFLAELERRTMVLPDGRKIMNFEGIFAKYLTAIPNGEEVLAETMEEVRRERNAHFEAELDEFFPQTEDLISRGISADEAAELRSRMTTFAEDWESDEMSIYDDYETARSRL